MKEGVAAVILPIVPSMNQNFVCTLPIGDENITLGFSLTFNEPGGYWFMAISNHSTGELLIDALPLLPGDYPSANLLMQHGYLNIGSAVLVSTTGCNSTPTFDSLGKEHFIVWSDN
ncbi:phage baseplate plug protein [Brevibacillus sp. SIMBA_076]|uniref:phage baseplate plug family protein n=1 Tax=Brevibacillus sp. SIMBA_076 TaxID=3085814 RepID=UPI00397BA2D2